MKYNLHEPQSSDELRDLPKGIYDGHALEDIAEAFEPDEEKELDEEQWVEAINDYGQIIRVKKEFAYDYDN